MKYMSTKLPTFEEEKSFLIIVFLFAFLSVF
jgi:hypothetical protein